MGDDARDGGTRLDAAFVVTPETHNECVMVEDPKQMCGMRVIGVENVVRRGRFLLGIVCLCFWSVGEREILRSLAAGCCRKTPRTLFPRDQPC